MKTKRQRKAERTPEEEISLRDAASTSDVWKPEKSPSAMIRTQIYLSTNEHRFLQAEAARRGVPMAAVIRSLIDEKMSLPEAVWEQNPLLAPPADPAFEGPEDGVLNHDHYIYGTPKHHIKKGGKWVPAPPLPEDYYSNEESRKAYDQLTGVKDE
jgi:hypothetical protein